MKEEKFDLHSIVSGFTDILEKNEVTTFLVAIEVPWKKPDGKAEARILAPNDMENWDEVIATAMKNFEEQFPDIKRIRQEIINSDTVQTHLKPTYRIWHDLRNKEWKIQRKGITLWHDVPGMISKDKEKILTLAKALKNLDHTVEGI